MYWEPTCGEVGRRKARRYLGNPRERRKEREGNNPTLIVARDGRSLSACLRHGFVHFEELVLVIRPGGDFEEGHAVGLLRGHCIRGAQLLRQL